MAYCSQGNHTKFGNRMNYIKEKTEPYHISISHFLCHCVTDSFLPIDIQLVLFVIYARFLYHYGITTLSLATWMGNRYSAYIYMYISILQIKQTINT